MSDTQKKQDAPKRTQSGGQLQATETDIAQHVASVLAEIVKANPGDADSVTAIGEAMLNSLMSLVAPPKTREDQMQQDLFQIEVLKRSGSLPPETLKQLIATQQNIEVQMGLRAPAEVYDFANDHGAGYVMRGPEGARQYMYLGGDGQWHDEGSPGQLAGEAKMTDYEGTTDAIMKEPGRIMTHLQKQIDAEKEEKKYAALTEEQDRVAKWGRAGGKESELGTGKGIYTDTPWSADQQKYMWEQGHRVEAEAPSMPKKAAGPSAAESATDAQARPQWQTADEPSFWPERWQGQGPLTRARDRAVMDVQSQGVAPVPPSPPSPPSQRAVDAKKKAQDLRESLLDQKRKEGKLPASRK